MTTRRRFLSGLVGTGSVIFGYSATGGGREDNITDKNVEVIGHRGSSAKYEDNSVEGIRFAGRNGADGVELDIRKTADDFLILNHYPFRFNGIGSYDISDRTYNEIKESTGSVVRLGEAVDIVRGYDMDLIVGMKEPANAQMIWDEIIEKGYRERSRMVMWTRHIGDYLVDAEKTIIVTTPPDTSLIQQAKEYNIDTILCHYANGGVGYFIDKANNNGLKAGYWSLVGSSTDVRKGLSKDPDIVMTNRPKEAVQMLGQY